MIIRTIVLFFILSLFPSQLFANEYWVSPKGSDAAQGTRTNPFATIQKAADTMQPGDTCFIRSGRYREVVTFTRSGTKNKPIQFVAPKGERVIIDGTDPVPGPWVHHKGRIWKTSLARPQVEQVFANDVMQSEARWPDMPFERRWERSSWGRGGKASVYGKIEAQGLGKTGVNWTGGIAMLNVGHQFFSWTRTVTAHQTGKDFIHYKKDLPGLAFLDPKKGKVAQGEITPWIAKQWQDDYFYLFGKLEGLTSAGEWFHNPKLKQFYYMSKGGKPPHSVHVKTRSHGMQAKGVRYLRFQGIHLFGCAFRFENCQFISLIDCHLKYPNYRRRLVVSEQKKYKGSYPSAWLDGSNNRMEHCSVQFAGGRALVISGTNNLLENSIIRDGNWTGTLHYPLVNVSGKGNQIRRNEIAQGGAPLLHHHGSNIIELNHIYNGGLLSEDVSAVYTKNPKARGGILRYNWIHGIHTGHNRGMGIRGDDLTRGFIVHHNVVWDCSPMGIIVKGGENQIFNNTVFDVTNGKVTGKFGHGAGLVIPTQAEPRKPWKAYHTLNIYLDVQNSDSIIANNLVDDIYYRTKKIKTPNIQANVEVKNRIRDYLVNPNKFDFRLTPSAQRRLPQAMSIKTQEGARFSTNYIGAYDPDQPPWKPGPNWSLTGQQATLGNKEISR